MKFGLKLKFCKNDIDKSFYLSELKKIIPVVEGLPDLNIEQYGIVQTKNDILLYTPKYKSIDHGTTELKKIFSFFRELFYMDYHSQILLIVEKTPSLRLCIFEGDVFESYDIKENLNVFTFNPVKYGYTTFSDKFILDIFNRIIYCNMVLDIQLDHNNRFYYSPYYGINEPLTNYFTKDKV